MNQGWTGGAALLLAIAAVALLSVRPPAAAIAQRDAVTGDPRGLTEVIVGQGFDKCEMAEVEALKTWIAASPYRAVNLYIGGSGRACSNLALSASLVAELGRIGWMFIPTWVGPQAPCYTGDKPLMASEPAMTYEEGIQQADAAIDAAAALGLTFPDGSGTVIYYDMERYDTGNPACSDAVRSFISGWSAQLRARGNLAGVYSSGPALASYAGIANVPDAVWPAHWIADAYDPGADVWDVYGLSNDLWLNHQRIRQYAGGHVETWGGVSLTIDSNVIDGVVASLRPHRTYLPALFLETAN